jgi:predicted DNA-binding WGR domain protein
MAAEVSYLELSQGSAHKFYEVTVENTRVTIRFGRIGDSGQTKVTDYPTPAKACAEADKKLQEKRRKGYEPAVAGVRKKRTITRRSMQMAVSQTTNQSISQPTNQARDLAEQLFNVVIFQTVEAPDSPATSNLSKPARTLPVAPVKWKFNTGCNAFGLFVDAAGCWVGNEQGQIYALDSQGQVQKCWQLPDGVKCIVADGDWLYVGCDDGNVYDLTGKAPRIAYQIAEGIDIYWLDIKDGILAVSDATGAITTINHEDESQWSKKSRGTHAWMVRCDEIGIYHGHSMGVTMYDWEDGRVIWERATIGPVQFGWQEDALVYACTAFGRIHCFTKRGEASTVYECDAPVFSCATSPDGKLVFAADNANAIYGFDANGRRLWKFATGCGSAYSMQFYENNLYLATTFGALACVDVQETALTTAMAGVVPNPVAITAPTTRGATRVTDSVAALETTTQTTAGVLVECVSVEGVLRVRVVSPGYRPDWYCQFPKTIREAGARYLVDEIRPAQGFYRAYGNIVKLIN